MYKFDNVHLINCVDTSYLNNNKIKSNNISKLFFFKNGTDNRIISNFKKINYDENRLKKEFQIRGAY